MKTCVSTEAPYSLIEGPNSPKNLFYTYLWNINKQMYTTNDKQDSKSIYYIYLYPFTQWGQLKIYI